MLVLQLIVSVILILLSFISSVARKEMSKASAEVLTKVQVAFIAMNVVLIVVNTIILRR